MLPPNTRRGNLLIAAFLLLLSVVFEQFFIAPFFPMIDAAGSLRLMVVFLDIPLSLPAIDPIPVTILFCIFYAVVIGPRLSRAEPKGLLGKRVWKALTGWYLLLGCIAAGGGLYYLVEGYLPKQVANGIDSFGLSTDLMLPYPSGELIHLHGSMIELLFGLLGLHLMARRTAIPQSSLPSDRQRPSPSDRSRPSDLGARPISARPISAVAEAQAIINTPPPPPERIPTTTFIKTRRREPALGAESTPTSVAMTAASRRSSVSVTPPPAARTAIPAQERQAPVQERPGVVQTRSAQDRPAAKPAGPAFPGEPPTCRLTTPPPIAIVMPRAAPTVGKAHPCFVIGGLKPTSKK